MPGEFAGSALHTALVQVPVVLLVLGAGIELLAFLWRGSSVRLAARWMILLGTVAAVPAAAAGFYDFWRANRPDTAVDDGLTWHAARSNSPIQGDAWEQARRHALVTGAATLVLLVVCIIYLGGTDLVRRRLHLPLLLVLVACIVAILLATYGRARGSGIADRADPATMPATALAQGPALATTGSGSFVPSAGTVPATQAASAMSLSPVQLHLILASLAVAICAVALGLSFRAASQSGAELVVDSHPSEANYVAAFVPHMRQEVSLEPGMPRLRYERVPAARYWLLGFVLVLATAAAGLWLCAIFTDAWTWNGIYQQLVQLDRHRRPEPTRRFAHAVAGAAALLLPLILALAARVSPRRGFIAAGFGLLLAAALAASVWSGSLLLLDSPDGSPLQFNRPPEPPATQHAPVPLQIDEPTTQPTPPPTSAPLSPIAGPASYPADL